MNTEMSISPQEIHSCLMLYLASRNLDGVRRIEIFNLFNLYYYLSIIIVVVPCLGPGRNHLDSRLEDQFTF